MKKLYDLDRVESSKGVLGEEEFNEDMNYVEKHLEGFTHLNIIHNTAVKDNHNAISIEEYKTFNSHIKTIASNLNIDIKQTPVLSMESLDAMSVAVLNRHYATEGFMQDLWTKIKEVLNKISLALKKFAQEHLSTLGRLKTSVANLQSALSKDIDLKDNSERKPVGKIKSVFKTNNTVTSMEVLHVVQEANSLIESSKTISKLGIETSKMNILDQDGLKKLEELKKAASQTKTPPPGKDNDTSIPDKIEESEPSTTIENTPENNSAFKKFMTEATKELLKHKDRPLSGGKHITDVTTDGTKITIETQIDSVEVTKMIPGEKSALTNILGICEKMIKGCEDDMKFLSTINDNFNNGLGKLKDAVGKLDANEHANLNKYISSVNKEINNRFAHYRAFFIHYNKVVRAIHGNSTSVGQGCIAYVVESLKYYS